MSNKISRGILSLAFIVAIGGLFSSSGLATRVAQANTVVDSSGCITTTEWVTPTDSETGEPIPDAQPILLTDKTCPADSTESSFGFPPETDAMNLSYYLRSGAGCGFNTNATVFYRALRGTGALGWYYKYYDGNGRLRTANPPIIYPSCTYDQCTSWSGRPANSNMNFYLVNLTWSSAASFYDQLCWR